MQLRKQRGQSLTEYLLILGLVAVTSIAVIGGLGSTVRSQISAMTQELAGIDSSAASAISQANAAKSLIDATADLGLDQLRGGSGE